LLDAIRSHVLALPDLVKFAVVIAIMVGVPRLAVRIRLPAMVGLLLSGLLWGRTCSASSADRPGADFYAGLGKLLLLFSAGLEIGLRPRPELDHVLRAGGGPGQ
jgi:Kef-type K+ transport system membrane component KefB